MYRTDVFDGPDPKKNLLPGADIHPSEFCKIGTWWRHKTGARGLVTMITDDGDSWKIGISFGDGNGKRHYSPTDYIDAWIPSTWFQEEWSEETGLK